MPMAPDNVPEWTWWGSLGAICLLVFHKWLGKLNPWPLFQMAAESLTGPVVDKRFGPIREDQQKIKDMLSRACRVIDKLPGADEAHAAVRAEDEKERYNWEP